MESLNRTLRKDLENAIKRARLVAEKGAIGALERLAVGAADPWPSMSEEHKQLRRRLRARARQLGDSRNSTTQTQEVGRLVQECAYEHWHRLIFSKFLAESNLLIEPNTQVAISIHECKELALEKNLDWLSLASEFAQKMLPSIFRQGDSVLEIRFTPEIRQELDEIIAGLPSEVFTAKDSLGWVYQFWQTQKKEEVNQSGKKIGGDELPAVTQLFTEDYMVEFLLDNTIGAWWSGKHGPIEASNEVDARKFLSLATKDGLPSVDWQYLRLVQDESDHLWRPAAGTFSGWPKFAREITLLDPCMGSGHFLVFALPILARLRMEEEKLDSKRALAATLEKNIYGLEIDPRCAQIAAFNLALSAWKMGGHRGLPAMNLACSGLAPHVSEGEWVALAGDSDRLKRGMSRLHGLFKDAPVLGSLINPRIMAGDMVEASFQELQPLFEKALSREIKDEQTHEVAVTARGLAKAAEILADQFTLVATNVPYLKRGKQTELLCKYCDEHHKSAKMDLATVFIERCEMLAVDGGTVTVVTPQSWLFQTAYLDFRKSMLKKTEWEILARLGPGAFETITGEVVNVSLVIFSRQTPVINHEFCALDVSHIEIPTSKANQLINGLASSCHQLEQLTNPDARIIIGSLMTQELLKTVATSATGMQTYDSPRFVFVFWEHPTVENGWVLGQTTVDSTALYSGCSTAVRWEDGRGSLFNLMELKRSEGYTSGIWRAGTQIWERTGVLVSLMGDVPCSLYLGGPFDNNTAAIVPHDENDLLALWSYCSSPEFQTEVRRIDQSLKVTTNTLEKIPFDIRRWRKVGLATFPDGLTTRGSSEPTEWSFNGYIPTSNNPLHIGVARLLGYQWPRQTGSRFPDCPALDPDSLETMADQDGIVCLPPINRQEAGASRLRTLLMKAYGPEWAATKERELLLSTHSQQSNLDSWLRDDFFKQHCPLFHQRPFIWHLWDGVIDGFSALVNYHKLVAPNGEGKKLLEKLTYTYLGDWISRQEQEQKSGTAGADAKVAAAKHLKSELEKILTGEPPYDIFVRWKPLHKQSIGWEPDVNDGVRINIRPFLNARTLGSRGKSGSVFRFSPKIKWDKDRGKEPLRSKDDYPWFWSLETPQQDFLEGIEFHGHRWNDVHYSNSVKQLARQKNNRDSSDSGDHK